MHSSQSKKKGLMIFSKDLDAHLANHMSLRYEFDMDIVFWRHRDKLDFEKRFGSDFGLYSLPEYICVNMPSLVSKDKKILLDRLESYELEYGLRSGNRYVNYDFYRGRKKKSSFQEHLIKNILFIEFFIELKIGSYDFIIGELSRSYCMICYDLAIYYNVHYLHPVNLGFFDGIAFTDDRFKIVLLDEKYKSLRGDGALLKSYKNAAYKLVENFRCKPSYGKAFLKPKLNISTSVIRRFLHKLSKLKLEYSSRKYDKHHYVGNIYVNPLVRFYNGVVRRRLKIIINRFSLMKNNNKGLDDFLYYPLHVHPETTTSLYSERTINSFSAQVDNIYYLSKFIPMNTRLVVKEHPHMVSERECGYYNSINSIYNVSLVSDEFSQFDLIKKSRAILTHCGTVGLEGLLLGKPIITLEDCYYDFIDGVVKIHQLADIEEVLRKASEYIPNENSIIDGVACLLYAQHPNVKNFSLDHYPDGASQDNLSLFCEAILNELNFRNKHLNEDGLSSVVMQ